jgi:hypothetical protein
MKKSYMLFLSFILIKTVVLAQTELGQIEVKIKTPEEVYPAVDSAGRLAYIFQNSKQYQFSFINADYSTRSSVLITRNPIDK